MQQEAQLMLTDLRDAFAGHSRSPNSVPFTMLGTVSYRATLTSSVRRCYDIRFLKKLWPWNGVKGHWGSFRLVSSD